MITVITLSFCVSSCHFQIADGRLTMNAEVFSCKFLVDVRITDGISGTRAKLTIYLNRRLVDSLKFYRLYKPELLRFLFPILDQSLSNSF